MNQAPDTAHYDPIAAEYDRWVSGDSPIPDDATFAAMIGDIAGQRVCAVACGAGREARFLAKQGATVTGVDLSDRLLDIARTREAETPLGITYLHGNAHDLADLPDANFDGATCYMALMDIPDHGKALRSIARILVPGGWFVLAITHPCFKPPAYGDLIDHASGEVRRVVGKYFEEGAWDGPGKFTDHLPSVAYHRMLSTYINTLIAAGFTIAEMQEPPRDTPVWQEAACVLYVRCRKQA